MIANAQCWVDRDLPSVAACASDDDAPNDSGSTGDGDMMSPGDGDMGAMGGMGGIGGAPEVVLGSITVHVEALGKPVNEAPVMVSAPDGSFVRMVLTDAAGAATLSDFPVGGPTHLHRGGQHWWGSEAASPIFPTIDPRLNWPRLTILTLTDPRITGCRARKTRIEGGKIADTGGKRQLQLRASKRANIFGRG